MITAKGLPITSVGIIFTPTLADIGASLAIATGGALTLVIADPSGGGSIWVRVADEVSGEAFEQEITVSAAAAAIVHDCVGVYLETAF